MRFLCSFLLLAVVAAFVHADDKVTLVARNEVVNGRIRKCDMDGIDVDVKDARSGAIAKRTLKTDEVADIEWSVNDQEFMSGLNAFKGGGYTQAAQRFQTVVSDPESMQGFRAEMKPYLFYIYGESLYRSGKPGEAVPVYEKLMNEYKTSYYIPQAVGSLVDCAILTKEFKKVDPLLGVLRGMGNEQKALADYYEGQLLLAQDKVKEADTRFGNASRSATTASTKGMALMGQARCAVIAKDLAKARQLAQQSLQAGAPASVASAAHLVIGEATLAEVDGGKADNIEGRLMDALLSFMRVIEMYPGQPNTEPVAMLRAGESLQRLSKLPNRGADRQRSMAMFTRLTSDARYKNTRWAQDAAESMKNFK